MFSPADQDLPRGWPGRVDGDRVIQLAAQTLEAFFTGGGSAREHAEYPLADVVFRSPVHRPPNVRVFGSVDPPRFTFGNTTWISGNGDEIALPADLGPVSYGLAVAAIIGAEGTIGGFTVMNDWTAFELEPDDPAKSKDFATTLGPWLVTPDEFEGTGALVARVNGQEYAHGDLSDMRLSWDELVADAARNTTLRPGDVLAAGIATGDVALKPGDIVELEVEGIGTLKNALG
jgi:2-keto-4-pentenoate hydratase/2-oxohepta-3-ene-1,7-dioic acid hydratase in catechol pathway